MKDYIVQRTLLEASTVEADNPTEAMNKFYELPSSDLSTNEAITARPKREALYINVGQVYEMTPLDFAAHCDDTAPRFLIQAIVANMLKVPGVLDAVMKQIPDNWIFDDNDVFGGCYGHEHTKISFAGQWLYQQYLSKAVF